MISPGSLTSNRSISPGILRLFKCNHPETELSTNLLWRLYELFSVSLERLQKNPSRSGMPFEHNHHAITVLLPFESDNAESTVCVPHIASLVEVRATGQNTDFFDSRLLQPSSLVETPASPEPTNRGYSFKRLNRSQTIPLMSYPLTSDEVIRHPYEQYWPD